MKIKIEGVNMREAQEILKKVPKKFERQVLVSMAKKASTTIVKPEIQRSTPTGSLKVKGKQRAKQQIVVKRGKGKTNIITAFKATAFYMRFIEFGTKLRSTKGRGKKYRQQANRGRIQARPFIRAAHERAVPKVINFFSKNFVNTIQDTLTKLISKKRK